MLYTYQTYCQTLPTFTHQRRPICVKKLAKGFVLMQNILAFNTTLRFRTEYCITEDIRS